MSELQKGKRIPNWELKTLDGQTRHAWDWRQKAHLILIVAPESSATEQHQWQAGIDAEKKQWMWLHAEVLIIVEPPYNLPPGVHAIDRYGLMIRTWPLNAWTFEDLQREYVYYEARHC